MEQNHRRYHYSQFQQWSSETLQLLVLLVHAVEAVHRKLKDSFRKEYLVVDLIP